MNKTYEGRLGCDAANISVMDRNVAGMKINSGWSNHAIVDVFEPGLYQVTLILNDELVVTKKMKTACGKFYVGDWCYCEAINYPPDENLVLICNNGADGEWFVKAEFTKIN